MKRGVKVNYIVIVVALLLVISMSMPLVSAGWFSDLVKNIFGGSDDANLEGELGTLSGTSDPVDNNWCNLTDVNRNGYVNKDDYDAMEIYMHKNNEKCDKDNFWCKGGDVDRSGEIAGLAGADADAMPAGSRGTRNKVAAPVAAFRFQKDGFAQRMGSAATLGQAVVIVIATDIKDDEKDNRQGTKEVALTHDILPLLFRYKPVHAPKG